MNQKKNVAIRGIYFEEYHSDCLSCGEPITHPLCPECIAKGFSHWIQKFPREDREIIQSKLRKFLHGHKYLDGKAPKCAACGKTQTHICPRCFTEFLYQITKEAGLGVRALTEFLFIFNFDFKHESYAKELEVMGGY